MKKTKDSEIGQLKGKIDALAIELNKEQAAATVLKA
jgi:hypothetical protein